MGELTTHTHIYINIYPDFLDTPRIYNLSKATRNSEPSNHNVYLSGPNQSTYLDKTFSILGYTKTFIPNYHNNAYNG